MSRQGHESSVLTEAIWMMRVVALGRVSFVFASLVCGLCVGEGVCDLMHRYGIVRTWW